MWAARRLFQDEGCDQEEGEQPFRCWPQHIPQLPISPSLVTHRASGVFASRICLHLSLIADFALFILLHNSKKRRHSSPSRRVLLREKVEVAEGPRSSLIFIGHCMCRLMLSFVLRDDVICGSRSSTAYSATFKRSPRNALAVPAVTMADTRSDI